MQFGPKRGHFAFIFDNFIKNFGLLVVALIIGLVTGNVQESLEQNIGLLVVALVLPVVRIVQYLTTRITVTPERILFTTGLIKKKKSEIPAATVTTIDCTQNLLQQLFKVYKIKIENTSSMSADNDTAVSMVLTMDEVETIKGILGMGAGAGAVTGSVGAQADGDDNLLGADAGLARTQAIGGAVTGQARIQAIDGANLGGSESHNLGMGRSIKIPIERILQMVLLQSKGVMLVEMFALVMVVAGLFGEGEAALVDVTKALWTKWAVVGVILAVAGLIVASFIVELLRIGLRYIDFTITDRSDRITVEYGLITKKKYNLVKSRISGFAFEQSFLMRRFGVGTLKVHALGFGNNEEDSIGSSIIHPLISEKEVRTFLGEFTEMFEEDCQPSHAKPGSTRYFFLQPGFIISMLIFLPPTVVFLVDGRWLFSAIGILIILLIVAGRIMERNAAAAGGNDREFVTVTGGFNRQTTFIRRDNVETVSTYASRWRRAKGFEDITIDFLGDETETSIKVKCIGPEMAEKLKGLLIY